MGFGGWMRDRPRGLERAYQFVGWIFRGLNAVIRGVGYERVDRLIRPAEELTKGILFDCRMCGQCILHSTGMTCPMTCPKNLRNGPCGGVRENGNCEVIPEMRCVWVEAYERSVRMSHYGDEIMIVQPPLDRRLEGSSAWINMLTGVDRETPAGWDTK